MLLLAYKYADDLGEALIVNANLGGDNCHRGGETHRADTCRKHRSVAAHTSLSHLMKASGPPRSSSML